MSRTEFTAKTKRDAWMRAEGRCEHRDEDRAEGWQICSKKLFPGDIFYDHIIADGIGGDNSLSNCQVLCKAHHDGKTFKADTPRVAKMKRQRDAHVGIKTKSARGFNRPADMAYDWKTGRYKRQSP